MVRPLLQDFFGKNIGKFNAYDFLAMLLKFYWLTFERNQGSSCLMVFLRDLFPIGGKHKFAIFKVFSAHIGEFLIFFYIL